MLTRQQKLRIAASLAEIFAAVGVMISVIYLALQVSQSNTQARLQTASDTLTHIRAPIQQFLAQPELAEIVRVGGTSPDELTAAEWFKFGYYYLMQFSSYEYLYYAYLEESALPQIWFGTDASWKYVMRQEPGVRRAWREWRHAFAEPFQGYVDSVVTDAERSEVE